MKDPKEQDIRSMCPSCKSAEVSPSRKHTFADRFMRWMGKTPYRCRECQKRFYLPASMDRRMRQELEWRNRSSDNDTISESEPKSGLPL